MNKKQLLPHEFLDGAAECLKCLAHPQRLRIVELLIKGDYTVEELAREADLTQPVTSGHLRLMHGKGLLASKREGRKVYYSVADMRLEKIMDCLKNCCELSGKA